MDGKQEERAAPSAFLAASVEKRALSRRRSGGGRSSIELVRVAQRAKRSGRGRGGRGLDQVKSKA